MAITVKPKYSVDITELQALYERNYYYLKKLLPDIQQTGTTRHITLHHKKTTTLVFNVLENTPYTSYIELQQHTLLTWLPMPKLYIRCYHDAKLAEIMPNYNKNILGVYQYPNPDMYQPNEKLQLNILLEEWLTSCLSHGYDTNLSLTIKAFS